MEPSERLLGIGEVAQRLGMSVSTVRRRFESGDLRAANVGLASRPVWKMRESVLVAYEIQVGLRDDDPYAVEAEVISDADLPDDGSADDDE